MSFDTYMLVHMPSKTAVYLEYGIFCHILAAILNKMGWQMSDTGIFEDRWDEMPDNLRKLGLDVPDEEPDEWFYTTFTRLEVSDILPGVRNGRDLDGML